MMGRLVASATAPLMKTLEVGTGDNAHKLGGETVLFRHEKTLVNKNLFAGLLCSKMTDEEIDAKIADFEKVDYERIGEREYVELLYLHYAGNGADKYTALVEKAVKANRALVLDCGDAEVAKAALAICKDLKPFPTELLPEGISLVSSLDADAPVASYRNADRPYEPGTSFTLTVDGFLVSDNVTVLGCEVIDEGFAHSDHNPVQMTFQLGE